MSNTKLIILKIIAFFAYLLFLSYLFLILIALGASIPIALMVNLFCFLFFLGLLLKSKKQSTFSKNHQRSEEYLSKQTIQNRQIPPQRIDLEYEYRKNLLKKCDNCGMLLSHIVKKCPICGKKFNN